MDRKESEREKERWKGMRNQEKREGEREGGAEGAERKHVMVDLAFHSDIIDITDDIAYAGR